MRRLSILLGLIACAAALLLLACPAAAQGGSEPNPEYVGAGECQSCHRGLSRDFTATLHALALIPVTEDATGVVADFSKGEDVRTLQLPGETGPRPFTLDDVAYILGAGRYRQRFVVEDLEGVLYVLPVEWDTASSAWHTYTLAESWPDPAYNFVENCAYCHTAGLDVNSGTWVDDGVTCETCHGPGSTHAVLAEEAGTRPTSAELAAIRGAIYNQPDSQMCGQCHSVGAAPDGHPFPTDYLPGDDLLAADTFTISTPGEDADSWWPTGHAAEVAMQFNEWFHSTHAGAAVSMQTSDYADDSCLRCHSGDYRYFEKVSAWFEEGSLDGEPPEAITVETAAHGVVCQTCHNPHPEEAVDFLLVDEPYAMCAECHSNQGIDGMIHHPTLEIFEGRDLVEGIASIPGAHFSAESGPDCQSCHLSRLPVSEGALASHALLPVMPGAPEALETAAGCTSCHTDVTTDEMALVVNAIQSDTAARLEAARAALNGDTPEWVTQAVAVVAGDGSGGLHNYTYTQTLLSAADAALGLLPEPAVVEVEETTPAWVELPLLGVVPGLTMPMLLGGGLATGVLLIAGLALLFLPSWRRLVGVLLLIAAAALATAPWWALEVPSQQFAVSGDNAYCMLCHGGEQTYTLVDNNTLDLGVDLAALAGSVHGANSSTGLMGCVDCHGADAFPHGPIPASLREYRLAGNPICVECHADSTAHYEQVLARNINVGCVDCHGAHNVQPASTLESFTPVQIPDRTGESEDEAAPGEAPVVRPQNPESSG